MCLKGGNVLLQNSFENVFKTLESISKELHQGVSGSRKQQLIDSLLTLRNYMDQCVQYWLKFEEQINKLQQLFNFTLPDALPQEFLNIIEDDKIEKEPFENRKPAAKTKEKKTKYVDKENSLFSLESKLFFLNEEQTISSFRRGLGFWELTMLEEAISEFEKVVKSEPDFIFGHFCLGLAYCQRKWYDKSLAELRLVKALCKDRGLKALASNAIGNIYAEQKDYLQALEEFKSALEIDPSFKMAWFNIGATLYNLRYYQDAIEAFKKAYNYFPNDWEISYYLGKLYIITGDFDNAIFYLNKSKEIIPSSSLTLFELGFLHELLGNEKLAQEYYQLVKKQAN